MKNVTVGSSCVHHNKSCYKNQNCTKQKRMTQTKNLQTAEYNRSVSMITGLSNLVKHSCKFRYWQNILFALVPHNAIYVPAVSHTTESAAPATLPETTANKRCRAMKSLQSLTWY